MKKSTIADVEIVRLYGLFKSMHKVSKVAHCSNSRVASVLNTHGIVRKNRLYKNLKSTVVIALYRELRSCIKVAKRLGCKKSSVLRILKIAGVSRVDIRRPAINDSVFDELSENAAYWMGMLMTDGNVYHPKGKRSPRVRLVLQEQDRNHIEKLRNFVAPNHRIFKNPAKISVIRGGRYNSKAQYGVSFSSQHIASVLAQHGIVPRKSYTAKTSQTLANNRHFWRGCIDGDGSIGISRTGYAFCSLCGSFDLLVQFERFARGILQCTPRRIWTLSQHHFAITYTGAKAIQLFHALYTNADVALDRKRIKVESIIRGKI